MRLGARLPTRGAAAAVQSAECTVQSVAAAGLAQRGVPAAPAPAYGTSSHLTPLTRTPATPPPSPTHPDPHATQADDVPDDAEEAGEGMDLELEGSRSIAEDQQGGAAGEAPAQPPQ